MASQDFGIRYATPRYDEVIERRRKDKELKRTILNHPWFTAFAVVGVFYTEYQAIKLLLMVIDWLLFTLFGI